MSKQYIEELIRREVLFVEEGFEDRECQDAAGIRVSTIRSKCGSADDERMLIKIIQAKEQGSTLTPSLTLALFQAKEQGFARLDRVIMDFRMNILPPEVKGKLECIGKIGQLESQDAHAREEAVAALPVLLQVHSDVMPALYDKLENPENAVRLAAVEA